VAFATVPAPGAPGAPGAPTAAPPPEFEQRGRRKLTPYFLLLPGMLYLALFFLVPLITLASTSTQTRPSGAEIGVFEQTFRWANYTDAISEYSDVFIRSFVYAGIATAIAFAIGYPLAYAIAFRAGRWKNLLLVMVIAPFFVSFILRTIAWRQILADEGWVVDGLQTVGLLGVNDRLLGTPIAVVAGLTYNFLPFMTLPIYASLERVDPRLIEASGDLYANGFTGFRKVTFPLSLPGVVAGTLLTFIPAAGDFVNSQLLGNPSTSMVGNVVDSQFFRVSNYPTASALSFILMACIFVLVAFYVWRTSSEELV
jgi:spermidine/putrescine transport system permease protein